MDSTILYSLLTFASATIALIVKYSYQSKYKNNNNVVNLYI